MKVIDEGLRGIVDGIEPRSIRTLAVQNEAQIPLGFRGARLIIKTAGSIEEHESAIGARIHHLAPVIWRVAGSGGAIPGRRIDQITADEGCDRASNIEVFGLAGNVEESCEHLVTIRSCGDVRSALWHESVDVLPIERISPAESTVTLRTLLEKVARQVPCLVQPDDPRTMTVGVCRKGSRRLPSCFVQIQESQRQLRVCRRITPLTDKESSEMWSEDLHEDEGCGENNPEGILPVIDAPGPATVTGPKNIVGIIADAARAVEPAAELVDCHP